MNSYDACILSGMLARSNMGQPDPSIDQVKRLRSSPPTTVQNAVCRLCEQFMESDEHERIFTEEAMAWFAHISDMPYKQFEIQHGRIAAIYNAAGGSIQPSDLE